MSPNARTLLAPSLSFHAGVKTSHVVPVPVCAGDGLFGRAPDAHALASSCPTENPESDFLLERVVTALLTDGAAFADGERAPVGEPGPVGEPRQLGILDAQGVACLCAWQGERDRQVHRPREYDGARRVGACDAVRMTEENQAAFAEMLANVLNEGALEDAVEIGLEEQGQFRVDVFGILDALASAGLKLVRDEHGDASIAFTTLQRDMGGAASN